MRGQATDVEYSHISWSTLRKLIPYLSRYKKRMLWAVLLLVAAKLASITLPFILKHIVDVLSLNSTENTLLVLPVGLLIAYGSVRLANVLFSELRDTIFGRVTEHAMHDIALKVFKHLHALDLDFHLNRKTGGLARDIERGTTGISFLLRFMVFNIIPTLLEIILVIIILSSRYSLWFGVIVFAAIVSYGAWSIYATERRTRFVRKMNKADSNTNTRAIDSLLNYETVKYFGNEDYEAKRYDKNLSEWEHARRDNRLSIFALNGGQATIISIFMTLAMFTAAFGVYNQTMTVGDFVLINAFMMQIFMPLNFLGFVYREIKGSMANIENMFKLLEQPLGINKNDNTDSLHIENGDIDINNISFSYTNNRNILNDINFKISAKRTTAIVGSSGSGKSTLSRLIFRFYDPNKGKILIDGKNIKQVSTQSLRENIAFVPQDTVLFNMSIYENIQYGRINATKEEILNAIKVAQLDTFISQLPEGLDTIVGERGLKLSGGEKQRVSIARAILKNPKIFIFDEATSSLDSHIESDILASIKEISNDKTCLMIAHRLSTIAHADLIVVMEQGKIIEQGTHAELIALNGRYAELWKIQEKNQKNTE